jgi:hypothetical protein
MYGPTTGAGDTIGLGQPAGAGDPISLLPMGAGNYLPFTAQGFLLVGLYSNTSGRINPDGNWIGE